PIPNPNADRIIAPSADPLPVTSVVPASTSNENASVASSFGPSDVPRTAESDNPHRRVGGRVRLTEHTFVSTDLARGQSNSLTMTVNSNLPAALSRSAPGQTGAQPLPDRASQVRTDVDVHSGDVTVAVDDPVLGAGGFSVREPIR
ncbi:MAG: hypothetical protein J2P18_19770, partial [Nocardia sp.]|nr:hypothetical protein [Nocardia sp.]